MAKWLRGGLISLLLTASMVTAQQGVKVQPVTSGRPAAPNFRTLRSSVSPRLRPGGLDRVLDGSGFRLNYNRSAARFRASNSSPLLERLGNTSGGLANYAPLVRRESLLLDHSIAGRIKKLRAGIEAPSLVPAQRQIDIERAFEQTGAMTDGDKQVFSDLMVERFAVYERERMDDGWAYLKSGDYRRAVRAFEDAESLDRSKWGPRFGQFLSVVVGRQYRRAVRKLSRIQEYDSTRPEGQPGMFEYDLSLGTLLASEQDLEVLIDQVRHFAEIHQSSVGARALYCYVLWYCGLEDAAIEAVAIADQISQTVPATSWAQFRPMMQAAQRKATIARERDDQPSE